MMVIKRIDPISLAKLHGIIMALMGLVIGLFTTLLGSIMGAIVSRIPEAQSSVSAGGFFLLGGLSIILLPLFYGIAGFVGGLIGGVLYNLVAKWIGGIEMELEEKK